MEKTEKLIAELYQQIDKISVTMIAPRIEEEKLWNWCGAWKQDTKAILKELESEVFDERD